MRPKKVILCVDDNEQALSIRKFMLETRGYRVLSACHAEQALEIFEQGGVDLVLSDLIMPRMDGNELVRRLKQISSDVPMVLVSGCVKAFDRASHADAFLPKGACSPLEVLERIRVLMARKRGPRSTNGSAAGQVPRPEMVQTRPAPDYSNVSAPFPVEAFREDRHDKALAGARL